MRKIDTLDVINIKKLADKQIKVNTEIRYGQAVFNATRQLFPYAANKLRDTECDCFYNDDHIDKFLEKLREFEAG